MISRSEAIPYALAVGVSLIGHVGFLEGFSEAALRAPPRKRPVEFALVTPPPPPEATPEAPPPPPPKKVKPPPPPEPNQEVVEPPKETAQPVFGVTADSVSNSGESGLSVRVGNTLMKEPEKEFTPPSDVGAYVKKALRVTKKPTMVGDCRGAYPPSARRMQIEGAVRLRVKVEEDGSVSDVTLLAPAGHGFDEAAVKALQRCRFTPAYMGNDAVAMNIEYVVKFRLDD